MRALVLLAYGVVLVSAVPGLAQNPPDGAAPTADEATAVEPTPEPLSPEQATTDEAIRARLQAIYDRIDSLRDVVVEVEAGIVRIRGEALTLEARQRAVELAQKSDGVIFVDDGLQVITDVGERISPALTRLREFGAGALAFAPLLFVALAILIVFLLVGVWLARWDGPHLRFAKTAFIRGLVRQFIRLAFGLTGLLLALELLDATALVGAVLGTAGVFGLALGFAFKDIVENHLAGIMLSLRQPFAPNDHLIVGDHEGKVIRLTARETILMTHSGNHVRIPNAELYRTVMTNFTQNPRRRFDFAVSVGTSDDLLVAQEKGVAALERMTGTMDDPEPSSIIAELGDSSVTLKFFAWVDQSKADFGRVRSEAIRLTKLALEESGISMPSPEYLISLSGTVPSALPSAVEGAAASLEERTPSSRPSEGRQQDVSVDRTLDEQIAEDRRRSEEDDLLEDDDETS